jgi:hypothetical protein
MLGEEVVDEGVVTQPSPLRIPPHGAENVGVDPNGDQSSDLRAHRRSPRDDVYRRLGESLVLPAPSHGKENGTMSSGRNPESPRRST